MPSRFLQIAALFAACLLTLAGTGCRKPEMQRCVNQQNIVVDDELCRTTGEQRILREKPAPAENFHYYYGGEGSTEPGTVATGGSYLRLSGHDYAVAGKDTSHLKRAWPVIAIIALASAVLFVLEGRRRKV
ncbi:MAG TPA: hypothetical protein VGB69_12920 [Edaphobacter sp.]